MRISQFKEVDYGAKIAPTPDELQGFVDAVRAAGVDCLNVSSRRFYRPEWPEAHPSRGIAGWIRSMLDKPVISCGSVGLDTDMFEDLFDHQDPRSLVVERDLLNVAERMSAGEFDLIGVGRAHVANPDFVTKVRERRFGEIALFKKSLHLTRDFEEGDHGVVGEYRKVADG